MTQKKIKPLSNRVLVQRAEAKVTKGGIILPESAQEKPKEGTVLAVGPGKMDDDGKTIPMNVKIGDKILFSSYAGTSVKSEDTQEEEYLLLSEDEILGVLV